jgi:hypothetical protein
LGWLSVTGDSRVPRSAERDIDKHMIKKWSQRLEDTDDVFEAPPRLPSSIHVITHANVWSANWQLSCGDNMQANYGQRCTRVVVEAGINIMHARPIVVGGRLHGALRWRTCMAGLAAIVLRR